VSVRRLDYLQPRHSKYNTHFIFRRYRQKVQYLFLVFSNNKLQKRSFSINESLGERILVFGLCLCYNLKWVSHIGTLLDTDTVSFKTHFRFEYSRLSIGDSVRSAPMQAYSINSLVKRW
jgi:hypothetical protein